LHVCRSSTKSFVQFDDHEKLELEQLFDQTRYPQLIASTGEIHSFAIRGGPGRSTEDSLHRQVTLL
jgi:hypothetical protein